MRRGRRRGGPRARGRARVGRRGRAGRAGRGGARTRLPQLGRQGRFVMGRVYDALKRAAKKNGARGNGRGEHPRDAREEKGIAPVSDSNGNGAHAEVNAKANANSRTAAAVLDEPAAVSNRSE